MCICIYACVICHTLVPRFYCVHKSPTTFILYIITFYSMFYVFDAIMFYCTLSEMTRIKMINQSIKINVLITVAPNRQVLLDTSGIYCSIVRLFTWGVPRDERPLLFLFFVLFCFIFNCVAFLQNDTSRTSHETEANDCTNIFWEINSTYLLRKKHCYHSSKGTLKIIVHVLWNPHSIRICWCVSSI